jgi:hypothetical protein
MAGAGRNREFLAGRVPWGSPGILRGASRGGSAGPGLRSLRRLKEGIFRAARDTIRVFASKAPSGPVPLPLLSRHD